MRIVITELGSKGDGRFLITETIQKAVDRCSENGGGTVVIPSGVYICGTVELKSNITLYLEQGAVLKASGNLNDYRHNGFYHNEMKQTTSLLYALGRENIRITGEGEIDLSGQAFINFKNISIPGISEEELDERQRSEATVSMHPRPTQPVFFHDCRHIRMDGITVRDAPCWAITFSTSRDIKVNNITVDNDLRVPNCDCIHLSSCKDVIITGSIFSCGDDCIAITGITNWEGISERIVVSDCIMRSRSAAVRIGHLSSKVRNISVSNIIAYNSNRGLAVFAGNNGWIENVAMSNLILETNLFAGNWWGKGEPLVICAAESDGYIRNVSIDNVKASSENGLIIVGQKGNIKDITLSNWRIELRNGYVPNRSLFGNVMDLRPAIEIPVKKGAIPWLYAVEAENIYLGNIHFGFGNGEEKSFDLDASIQNVQRLEQHNVRQFMRT
jgi:hypothetical protein